MATRGQNRDYARQMADQCEQAADVLAGEAAELADQDDDLSRWRQQMKTDAAATACGYAEQLREQAEQGVVTDADIARAELVTLTAQMDGITIDGGRMDGHDPVKKQAQQDLVTAGLAEHVAEPGQVPFYRLTSNARTDSSEAADDTDAQGDPPGHPYSPAPADQDTDDDCM